MTPTSRVKYMKSSELNPLVTVLITARDRPDELRVTLRGLRAQTYQAIELLVVDDCSDTPLEPLVHEMWPGATLRRNEKNLGLIASRSLGMRLARGEYIVSLDDDSCLVEADALAAAVVRMEREKDIGVMTFFVHHGTALPPDTTRPAERYVASFIGCGHMIRREVVETLGGYRDFYFYYGEEAEYSLRVLDAGWKILFFPRVVVHHRVSETGRAGDRILFHSYRNNLWTLLLRIPWPRVLFEGSWRLGLYCWESLRQLRPWPLVCAILSCTRGLPRVLRLRAPISERTLQRYDALRFRHVLTRQDYEDARRPSPRDMWQWFSTTWRCRPKPPCFWERGVQVRRLRSTIHNEDE
jgi:GT2 family glycosyltransferase